MPNAQQITARASHLQALCQRAGTPITEESARTYATFSAVTDADVLRIARGEPTPAPIAPPPRRAPRSPAETIEAFRVVLEERGHATDAATVADAVAKGHTPETLAEALDAEQEGHEGGASTSRPASFHRGAQNRATTAAAADARIAQFRAVFEAHGWNGTAAEIADAVAKGHTPDTLAAALDSVATALASAAA